jgi:tetratricopeptide (TPR) repeat protein
VSQADPDRRARLQEDCDFLLSSLDDLDAERAAGDVDEDDYRALKADYTARAAQVIRNLAGDPSGSTPGEPDGSETRFSAGPPGRKLAWMGLVVVLAAVGGFLLAQYSGSRRTGDSITGDIRTTSREQLFEAQQAFSDGDTERARELYDEVLREQPASVEALAYRGWLTSRTGDAAGAVADLEEAIAIDPDYADAHVFRAIVALDLDDPATAAAELAVFDSLDPPPFAQQLVAGAQVRERIALARVSEIMLVADPPPFSETGLTVADLAAAAEVMAADGELLDAVKLFDAVLAENPDDVEALTYRGWLIARAGDPQLLEGGIVMLDAALEIDPTYAPALVYRAFALNESGDRAGAAADLAAFDALPDQPRELIQLLADFGLRDSVAG